MSKNTIRVLQTAIGFIDAGGRSFGKAKMKELREALATVVNTWEGPGTYEEFECGKCSGNGWFGRGDRSGLEYERLACERCGGTGVLYRRCSLDRNESKGAKWLRKQGIAKKLVRWG